MDNVKWEVGWEEYKPRIKKSDSTVLQGGVATAIQALATTRCVIWWVGPPVVGCWCGSGIVGIGATKCTESPCPSPGPCPADKVTQDPGPRTVLARGLQLFRS